MEDVGEKVVPVEEVNKETGVLREQDEGEDSDDSFHSLHSDDDDDDEAPLDTESSMTESSEQRLNPNKNDDTDDDDAWVPADQHTPKVTRIKRRHVLEEDNFSDENRSDKDAEENRGGEKNTNSDKNAEENKGGEENANHQPKNKEDEDEDEEDFIDEEHLKDLEVTMTDEERKRRHDESLKSKESGNTNFKSGSYIEAVWDYTAGLRTCPLPFTHDRAVLYANRAAAKARLERRKAAIRDCSRAVELDDKYTKAILRRATLQEEEGQLDDALKDFQRVLELDPSCSDARFATMRLPDMINERNEKLKEEMMGKLKDLGNMFLRPFGLSTSNFEMKQAPGSDGYNISFKQNPKS